MSQTFLKMQKRGSQVALYLVIVVAVVGFVVSRLPGGSEESAPKSVAKAKPVRLFRPEAFESLPAETTPAAKGLASSVITAEAKSELPETESATPESVEHPSREPEAVGGAMPQPEARVAAVALPIEPLPSWFERELLANLEETAIELDLYSVWLRFRLRSNRGLPNLKSTMRKWTVETNLTDVCEMLRATCCRVNRKLCPTLANVRKTATWWPSGSKSDRPSPAFPGGSMIPANWTKMSPAC